MCAMNKESLKPLDYTVVADSEFPKSGDTQTDV